MEFLNPTWLWLIPVSGFYLLYIYARKGSSKEKHTSSIMFLQQLKQSTQKKFLPFIPPRFLFDLLICLLLIIALAEVVLETKQPKVAIILDNSLSMAAIDMNRSLLDLAKQKIIQVAELDNPDAIFKVYKTSPNLQVMNQEFVDLNQLKSELNKIDFEYAEDNILNAVSEVKEVEKFDSIEVFSDHPITRQGLANVTMYSLRTEKPLNNIAFKTVLRDENTLKLGIVSYADESAKLSLLIESLTSNYRYQANSLIKPFESKEINLPIKTSVGPLKASFKATSVSEKEIVDSLAEDNQMFVNISNVANSIVLVSAYSPRELQLDTLENEVVNWVSIDKWSKQSSNAKLFIFHNWAPKELPKSPSLFINSFSSLQNAELSFAKPQNLTAWDNSHEILKYLLLKDFKLKLAYSVIPPNWANSLLEISGKTIAFAGENAGVRYAFLGFEILPFRGSLTPVPSILFLNALNWLTNNQSNAGLSTNSLKRLSNKATKVYYQNTKQELIVDALNTYLTKYPGLVIEEYNSKQEYQTVNFVSQKESNLGLSDVISLPSEIQSSNINTSDVLTNYILKVVFWLAIAGIFLFCLLMPLSKRLRV
ncbi:MAG: BatA domain-containing protein [Bdellovibrionales bacterium]|nr:BatA domain-containing protein [Bdellovibrionales bacterium]